MAPKKSRSSKKGKAKTGSSSANPDVKKEVALDVQESMPMAGSEQQDEIAKDITYKMIDSKILREGFEQMDEILTKMKDIHKKLTMDYYIEEAKTSLFVEQRKDLYEKVESLRNNVKGLKKPGEPKEEGKISETDNVVADENDDNIAMQDGFNAMKKHINDMSIARQKLFVDYSAQQVMNKRALERMCDLEVEKANLEEELQRLKKDKK